VGHVGSDEGERDDIRHDDGGSGDSLEERDVRRVADVHDTEAWAFITAQRTGVDDRQWANAANHAAMGMTADEHADSWVSEHLLELVVRLERVAEVVWPHGVQVILARGVAQEEVAA